MASSLEFPIAAAPIADWKVVGERVAARRQASGLSASHVADRIEATEAELLAFEAGEPVLGGYELRELATALGTTTGAWFCGDEEPLFRGNRREADAALAAAEIGRALMAEYLAAETLIR